MRDRPASKTVLVQRAVDLIENRFADPLTTKFVSAAVRTTPARLARVFHQETGITLHEYLTRLRLERASHLLRMNLKVESVAHSVGYRSKKNFYRQFQRHFGSTPELFRRREPQRTAVVSDGLAVAVYAAQFDGTSCRITVEPQNNVKGRPSFVATPYVMVDHGLQPFAVPSEYVEITGETEAQAIERAAVFLEHRFGARAVPPIRLANGQHGMRLLPPRP
jgi:AraC-like DNA-binding protein